jgi:nitroreductase
MRDHPCQPLAGYQPMDDAERIERVTAFRGLMAGRRTVRDFSDRPVPRAVVEEAILTAGSAPSGANHQPWFFSVIESGPARARIRAAAEAEEREFYATKAPQEWLDALAGQFRPLVRRGAEHAFVRAPRGGQHHRRHRRRRPSRRPSTRSAAAASGGGGMLASSKGGGGMLASSKGKVPLRRM